jgi:hypothetical protein
MWLMTMMRLVWEMSVTPHVECTRCGGHHSLSRCTWPATEKGVKDDRT